jgi:S1-C subfamily serine protease
MPGIVVQGGYIPGMSGGPVIDKDGQVVGIIQQSDQNIGYGVGVDRISEFLLDAGK